MNAHSYCFAELSEDHNVGRDNATLSKASGFCNNSGLQSDPFVSRGRATWPEALDICSNEGSMASFDYYDSASNQIKSLLLSQLNGSSGWLYGLEGISECMVICKIVYGLSFKI